MAWKQSLVLLSLVSVPWTAHANDCDTGVAAYESRDFHTAATALSDCMSAVDTQDTETLYQRGRSYMKIGRHDEALADFMAVAALDEAHAGSWNSRAWVLYLRDELSAAMEAADRALELAPEDPRILDTRAHILAARGDADAALESFEEGIRFQTSEGIAKIQRQLMQSGIDPGPIDGVYGPRTRSALARCAQEACNIWE